MADNLTRGSMSKLSVPDCDASGTATEDKYEWPVSPKSTQSSKIERDSPITSACLFLDNAQIFHQNEIEGEISVSKQKENTDAIEKH
jgi:hypothetical protein